MIVSAGNRKNVTKKVQIEISGNEGSVDYRNANNYNITCTCSR